MEQETTFPSFLPELATLTSAVHHHGVVFPATSNQGRQPLSLAPPPHFLTSHATPVPNLVIGLGPLPSSWKAPKSPLQPTNFPEKFLPPLWFPAMSNQQHDTQKGSSVLGETSQG